MKGDERVEPGEEGAHEILLRSPGRDSAICKALYAGACMLEFALCFLED